MLIVENQQDSSCFSYSLSMAGDAPDNF